MGFVRQANYPLYDFFLRLRPAQRPSSRIVIIGIDDLTLRVQPTLPRDRH